VQGNGSRAILPQFRHQSLPKRGQRRKQMAMGARRPLVTLPKVVQKASIIEMELIDDAALD